MLNLVFLVFLLSNAPDGKLAPDTAHENIFFWFRILISFACIRGSLEGFDCMRKNRARSKANREWTRMNANKGKGLFSCNGCKNNLP